MIFFKRIHDICGKYLEAGMVALDPQFNHIVFLNAHNNTLYFLTPVMIVQHFIQYKNNFEETKEYKLKTLPALKTIQLISDFSVINIKFAKIEGELNLIVGYYNGKIESYSSKGWNLARKFPSLDLLLTFVAHDKYLFLIDYSREIKCVDIKSGWPIVSPVNAESALTIHNTKAGLLIETMEGQLVDKKGKVLAKHPRSRMISESVTAQIQNLFQTDFSGQYLIFKDLKRIYDVETMEYVAFQIPFTTIAISPFQYEEGRLALMSDSLGLVLVNIWSKKQYVRIENMKRPARELLWVGPFQVLVVDETDKVYYLELHSKCLTLK